MLTTRQVIASTYYSVVLDPRTIFISTHLANTATIGMSKRSIRLRPFLKGKDHGEDTETPRLLPRGYAWYAAWIAEDKDNEADVYRVFRRLTTRTLLYRQSELMDLEALLADTDHGDAVRQRNSRPGNIEDIDNLTTRWPLTGDDSNIIERQGLIKHIDEKLKEYRMLHTGYLNPLPITKIVR